MHAVELRASQDKLEQAHDKLEQAIDLLQAEREKGFSVATTVYKLMQLLAVVVLCISFFKLGGLECVAGFRTVTGFSPLALGPA